MLKGKLGKESIGLQLIEGYSLEMVHLEQLRYSDWLGGSVCELSSPISQNLTDYLTESHITYSFVY